MKKIKVVIIEDNALMANMISTCLKDDKRFDVLGAFNNGEEGIRIISSLLPDIVVLDLIMPEMDGFELLNRSLINNKKTKYLIVSSLNDDYFIKKAFSLGAKYYLVKPFSNNVLKERIIDIVNHEIIEENEYSDEIINEELIVSRKEEQVSQNNNDDSKNKLNERISNILHSIGIPANIVGFKMLKEAIFIAIEKPELVFSITKGLYPEVAIRTNSTSHGVERAIRHAIDISWSRGKIDYVNSIFGMQIYSKNEKPTNSEFIALISDKLLSEGIKN